MNRQTDRCGQDAAGGRRFSSCTQSIFAGMSTNPMLKRGIRNPGGQRKASEGPGARLLRPMKHASMHPSIRVLAGARAVREPTSPSQQALAAKFGPEALDTRNHARDSVSLIARGKPVTDMLVSYIHGCAAGVLIMPTSETHCRHIRPAFLHFQKESNSGKQIVATEKHHRIGPARCEQQHAGVHAYGIVPSFSKRLRYCS